MKKKYENENQELKISVNPLDKTNKSIQAK